MNRIHALTERMPEIVVRHLFEIGFCGAFVLYLFFLQAYQGELNFILVLPVGLLLAVVTHITREPATVNWPLAIVVGYIVGWTVRKLWKQGAIGQIAIVVLIGLNIYGFSTTGYSRLRISNFGLKGIAI